MKRNKLIFPLTLLAALLTGCGAEIPDTLPLTVEAGAAIPEASAFFAEPEKAPKETPEICFASDSGAIDTAIPGSYGVKLEYNGTVCETTLTVQDTVAPRLRGIEEMLILECGDTLTPELAVEAAEDATALRFRFGTEPDMTKTGEQQGTVIAEDLGGNTAEAPFTVLVVDKILNWEATAEPVTEAVLRAYLGLNADPENPGEELLPGGYVGESLVVLPLDSESAAAMGSGTENGYTFLLTSADTTPPAAEPVSVTGWCLQEQPIESFYTDLSDATAVEAAYLQAPDWEREGTQTVSLQLSDSAGNTTEISAELTLTRDTTPPTIYMARDFYAYAGGTISYFKEIFAGDDLDPDVELTVDKSAVNPREGGTYPITYTATDHSGNSTSVTVNLTLVFTSVTDEELDEIARAKLAELTTEDMTAAQKVKAVFDWCYDNMHYNGHSDKTDFNFEAVRGLTRHNGDCYTFYATVYALLDRIEGVEVLSVQRYGGNRGGSHYWCLVNIEGTGWYHLDTTNTGPSENYRPFMKTTAELDQWYRYNWSFDESLYPEVATTPFSMEE